MVLQVFCTKRHPNCRECPLRSQCEYAIANGHHLQSSQAGAGTKTGTPPDAPQQDDPAAEQSPETQQQDILQPNKEPGDSGQPEQQEAGCSDKAQQQDAPQQPRMLDVPDAADDSMRSSAAQSDTHGGGRGGREQCGGCPAACSAAEVRACCRKADGQLEAGAEKAATAPQHVPSSAGQRNPSPEPEAAAQEAPGRGRCSTPDIEDLGGRPRAFAPSGGVDAAERQQRELARILAAGAGMDAELSDMHGAGDSPAASMPPRCMHSFCCMGIPYVWLRSLRIVISLIPLTCCSCGRRSCNHPSHKTPLKSHQLAEFLLVATVH